MNKTYKLILDTSDFEKEGLSYLLFYKNPTDWGNDLSNVEPNLSLQVVGNSGRDIDQALKIAYAQLDDPTWAFQDCFDDEQECKNAMDALNWIRTQTHLHIAKK